MDTVYPSNNVWQGKGKGLTREAQRGSCAQPLHYHTRRWQTATAECTPPLLERSHRWQQTQTITPSSRPQPQPQPVKDYKQCFIPRLCTHASTGLFFSSKLWYIVSLGAAGVVVFTYNRVQVYMDWHAGTLAVLAYHIPQQCSTGLHRCPRLAGTGGSFRHLPGNW